MCSPGALWLVTLMSDMLEGSNWVSSGTSLSWARHVVMARRCSVVAMLLDVDPGIPSLLPQNCSAQKLTAAWVS